MSSKMYMHLTDNRIHFLGHPAYAYIWIYVYIHVYTHIHAIYIKEIYLKELTYAIVKAGKSVICRAGWQPGCPHRISVIVLKQNFFSGKPQSS